MQREAEEHEVYVARADPFIKDAQWWLAQALGFLTFVTFLSREGPLGPRSMTTDPDKKQHGVSHEKDRREEGSPR